MRVHERLANPLSFLALEMLSLDARPKLGMSDFQPCPLVRTTILRFRVYLLRASGDLTLNKQISRVQA